jgi:hypothetical protein
MQRRLTVLLLLLSAAGATMAQNSGKPDPEAAKFWAAPGETDHDKQGKVTYSEIRDPKTFTTRVFTRGQWLTYHYLPNTVVVASIDTPDSIDELQYDGSGAMNGVKVRANGKMHELDIDAKRGAVSTPGMPEVSVVEDSTSAATRHSTVKSGGRVIASVSYSESGEIRTITVGSMVLSLELVGGRVHETLSANGRQIADATAAPVFGRSFPFSLDAVADRLGLSARWAQEVTPRTTATGYLTTLQTGGRVVGRIVSVGEYRAVFDAKGAPLFYDVTLDYGAFGGNNSARSAQNTTAYVAAVPTHVIVGADGSLGAYLENPGDGAIRAFWSTGTNYSYAIYHRGSSAAAAAVRPLFYPIATAAGATPRPAGRNPKAFLFTVCDTETTCTYADGCPSCAGCSTTNYWCDIGSGGGGGITDPYGDGSGGPTGGPSGATVPGNHVVNYQDITLAPTVTRAIDGANSKLTDPQCAVQLLKDTKWSGTNAWDTFQTVGGGQSTSNWFGAIGWYYGGGVKNTDGKVPCDLGNAAWTYPGSLKDYICETFKTAKSPSNLLLHEMLHTIGVPECNGINSCPDPTWPTPAQLDDLVASHCGAN